MSFIRHKDLGYNKEALLYLNINGNADVAKGYESFRAEVGASSLINGFTTSNLLIMNGLNTGNANFALTGGFRPFYLCSQPYRC